MKLLHFLTVCMFHNAQVKIFFALFFFNPTTGFSEENSFEQAKSFYEAEQFENSFKSLDSLEKFNFSHSYTKNVMLGLGHVGPIIPIVAYTDQPVYS